MPIATVLSRVLAALAGLALLGIGGTYGLSEWKLRRSHDAPLVALRPGIVTDPAAGERLARIVGCWAGCHGPRGEGGSDQVTGMYRITAPTLAPVIQAYGDAELVRLIRYGVKRDGNSALGMPAATFWPLGEQALADIIAHLRAQPMRTAMPRERQITWRGRWSLATGELRVSADQVDRSAPRWGELPRSNAFERGRYLASIVCSECHGRDFEGDRLQGGPSLAAIAAYSIGQFREFMRTGKPIDGREIPAMNWLPEVGFTDAESEDLYVFLRRRHGLGIEPAVGSQSP
ncbi:MAG: hypothetical protein KF822_01700 [Steroidobacteraceae bacterium]|nr:hypothetical protein [Steroidobacteraceae bacterium]